MTAISHLSLYSNISNCSSVTELVASKVSESVSSHYGDREKFKTLKQQAVQELSEIIKGMQSDNPENFRVLFDKAAALRRHIASDNRTKDAEEFGVCREREASGAIGEQLTTLLVGQDYYATNNKIKDIIIEHLKYIKEKDHAYRVTKKDAQTSYSIKLITRTQRSSLEADEVFELLDLINKPNIHNEFNDNLGVNQVALDYLSYYKEWLEEFKTVKGLEFFHSKDKFYVFMGRKQIKGEGGQWLPTTRHIVVIPCSDNGEITKDNLDDFRLHFAVKLLHTSHQDFKLHEKTMSELFNKILKATIQKEDRLEAIREFEFRLHNLCYLKRGSAATNEMILEAIRNTVCPEYTLKGNLEALAQPYLCNYV